MQLASPFLLTELVLVLNFLNAGVLLTAALATSLLAVGLRSWNGSKWYAILLLVLLGMLGLTLYLTQAP
jgi:hypothetical protein